jgi:amidase
MGFEEYARHDAVGLAALIRSGEVSAREVVEAAIERIEREDPYVNAVVLKTYERALRLVEEGIPDGPFAGVPFLLKDLGAAWEGVPLTNGSRSMRSYVPDYSATIVRRFERAGLVILGKTNTPEFGLDGTTEPLLHGVTRNPWDRSVTVGGSSGGAAAAVASGMVPAAHASDGGGSIRIPASHTGLFGLKPTRARTPVGPVFGEAWFGFSVGHAITRSVRDSAVLLDAIRGPEPGDPYQVRAPGRPFAHEPGVDPGSLRVGVVPEAILGGTLHPDCVEAVNRTADLLHELGHRVEHVRLPIDGDGFRWSFIVLAAAQAAENHRLTSQLVGRELGAEDVELEQRVLAAAGSHLSAEEFVRALGEVRSIGRLMGRVMEGIDVLLTATVGRPPHPHGATKPKGVERLALRAVANGAPRRVLEPILERAAVQHDRPAGHVAAAPLERRRPSGRGAVRGPLRRRGGAVPPRSPTRGGPPLVRPPARASVGHQLLRVADDPGRVGIGHVLQGGGVGEPR